MFYHHHYLQSPLSTNTTIYHHHYLQSPLSTIITIYHHHYLPTPLSTITTIYHHHYLPSPLSTITTIYHHHYLPSPLFTISTIYYHHYLEHHWRCETFLFQYVVQVARSVIRWPSTPRLPPGHRVPASSGTIRSHRTTHQIPAGKVKSSSSGTDVV